MDVNVYQLGVLETNCYVVGGKDGIVIVDPGGSSPHLLDAIEKDSRKVAAILLTHGHFDHIAGVDGLVKKYQVPVYALDKEKEMLTDPSNNLAADLGGESVTIESEITYFSEGDVLEAGGLSFETIWVPGHSYGGCCYYVKDEGVLFSGDTLFCGSIGRSDFPGGDMKALVDALKQKVMILPDETKVLPGHGPGTDIRFEKKFNLFL